MKVFGRHDNLDLHFFDQSGDTAVYSFQNKYLRFYVGNLLPRHIYSDNLLDLVFRFYDDIKELGHQVDACLKGHSVDVDSAASGKADAPDGDIVYVSSAARELIEEWGDSDTIKKKLAKAEKAGLRHLIDSVFARVIDAPASRPVDISTIAPYSLLARTFNLEVIDLDILLFIEICNKITDLDAVVDDWDQKEMTKGIAIACGYKQDQIHRHLSPQSRLVRQHLIEVHYNYGSVQYILSDAVIKMLATDGCVALHEDAFMEIDAPGYALESFQVEEKSRELCKLLLASPEPVHILLHGSEGTGKTEFAKAVIAAAGQRILLYQRTSKETEAALFHLEVAAHGIPSGSATIIVDEAEDLLSPESGKSRINLAMEYCPANIVWIVNSIEDLPPSTRRRFTFSVGFKPLSDRRLKALATEKLAGLPISAGSLDAIADMAGRMGMNMGASAKLHTTLSVLGSVSRNEQDLIDYSSVLLAANSRLLGGALPGPVRVGSTYSIDALNLSVDVGTLVTNIGNALIRSERGSGAMSGGYRLLFHGDPGTGKTELGRHLADQLDRRLEVRRFSDLVDALVGASEKNIAAMFSGAEADGSILLIDEIESLTYSRSRAQRSWELSQVDEFLTRMDEFSGILICTTNYLSLIDRAVIRRFHRKVEFFPLAENGVRALLSSYFPEVSCSEHEIRRLVAGSKLVPGDFMIARRVADLGGEDVDAGRVIDLLEAEARQRKGTTATIGFAAS